MIAAKKHVFLLISLVVVFLVGCGGGDGDDNSVTTEALSKLERIDIMASPVVTRGTSALAIAKGKIQPVVAIGHYTDGTSQDISTLVSWETNNPMIVSMNVAGQLTGIEIGTAEITASKDNIISNKMTINVTNAIVTELQVIPPSLNLTKGLTQQTTAIATYSDNTTADVSHLVDWLPLHPSVITISPMGLLSAMNVGNTELRAVKKGVTSNIVPVNISDAIITAIQITPANITLAKGQMQQLTAIATYSDNSTADVSNSVVWSSLDISTATVTPMGLLSGIDIGNTEVVAIKDDVVSNTAAVSITNAIITAIQITPANITLAKGQMQQLTATATYSDNTTADVTSSIVWLSSDPSQAIVSSTGVLTGVGLGNTQVRGSTQGITSNTVTVSVTEATITGIQVTPASVTLAKGQTQQLTATATYSDNTTSDVSHSVAWSSSNTSIVTVSLTGLLTGAETGYVEVEAFKDGITSNWLPITVTDAVATSIQLTPDNVTLPRGQTLQLTAMVTYSDNTTVNETKSFGIGWLSLDTSIATILGGAVNGGLLTGVEIGNTEVRASTQGLTSNTVAVSVSDAAITGIQVTPASVTLAKGQTQQLTAIATYSDNTTSDVSDSVAWLSSNTSRVTVTPTGLLTGVDAGYAEVEAFKDGITSNWLPITVTDAVATSIQLTPDNVTLVRGETLQLTAMVTYSDNTTVNETKSFGIGWLSLDTSIATVLQGTVNGGILTGVEVGNTGVTASTQGLTSNTVNINVINDITSIAVNEFTFGRHSGFPTTGFVGAQFALNVSGTANDYHWSSNAAWVSIDGSAVVSFTAQGNASPVTIIGTPVLGGDPVTYVFQLSRWFFNNGGTMTSFDAANTFCNTNAASLPPIDDLVLDSNHSRVIGRLWSEWGRLDVYTTPFGEHFINGDYWTSTVFSSLNEVYGTVHLGNGDISSAYSDELHATVCIKYL
ncbi:TPA: Ig-like domain-containing protein [Vibrio cholerae]|nr:Ig-like domain-containing protein [Vibrio cholerae]